MNGHPEGMYMYGKCCLLGLGGDTNYQEAFSFTEMAANKGDINALDGLGYLYERGLGCKKDIDKAIYYYQMAANMGCKASIDALKKLRK